MDANKEYLLNFLQQDQQLSIPIYQRKYSWTNLECKQLFNDILRVGNDEEKNHFIGSIVYMKKDSHIAGPINDMLIIDGQQRITTLTLLISAFANFLKENPNENIGSSENLVNYYILNDKEKGEKRYKLLLTRDDKSTLIKIIDNLLSEDKIEFNEKDSERILENYNYFTKQINEENLEIIYTGLRKLIIIYIALEQGIDNPQLIFESLNSTGLELNQSDLIRNYILMGLEAEEQEDLYLKYWHEMELIFENSENESFDNFLRDYLTIHLDRIPTFRNVYLEFKKYSKRFENIEKLVKDIYTYSQYFLKIAMDKEEDEDLNKAFKSLNSLGYDVTRPFTLQLYRDYFESKIANKNVDSKNNKLAKDKEINSKNKELTKEEFIDSKNKELIKVEFIEILNLTESYLLRRLICGIPTVSLNKTFASIYNELAKENYLESYKINLLLKDSYKRMPKNTEFRNNCITKDFYNLKGKNIKYIFSKLENFQSKEISNIDNYTIEHIMPQNPNLSKEWKEELGHDWKAIQKNYLHTIGNLTLTGYNSEMSDKSFKEKRDMKSGFKDSAIRLNKGLRDLDNWNEIAIQKRTDELISKAIEIWPYPDLDEKIIEEIEEKNSKKSKKTKEKGLTKTQELQLEYWAKLNEYIKNNSKILKSKTPQPCHWCDLSLGSSEAYISLTVNSQKNFIACGIFIKHNNELFKHLYSQKEKFNPNLEWENKETNKSSSINLRNFIDFKNKLNWNEAIEWQITTAEKLYKEFSEKIKEF